MSAVRWSGCFQLEEAPCDHANHRKCCREGLDLHSVYRASNLELYSPLEHKIPVMNL